MLRGQLPGERLCVGGLEVGDEGGDVGGGHIVVVFLRHAGL
jgi:hypothetical protein